MEAAMITTMLIRPLQYSWRLSSVTFVSPSPCLSYVVYADMSLVLDSDVDRRELTPHLWWQETSGSVHSCRYSAVFAAFVPAFAPLMIEASDRIENVSVESRQDYEEVVNFGGTIIRGYPR
jgi:hypothetical protein